MLIELSGKRPIIGQDVYIAPTAVIIGDVTIDDGKGGTDTQTVMVTVTGANDAPELTIVDIAATEDGVAVTGSASVITGKTMLAKPQSQPLAGNQPALTARTKINIGAITKFGTEIPSMAIPISE